MSMLQKRLPTFAIALLSWLGFSVATSAQTPAPQPATAPPKLTRAEADTLLERAKKLQDELPKLLAEGRAGEVMANTREIVAIRKRALGEHHPAYAAALNNLGRLLWAQGDLTDARSLLEQALAIEKEILTDSHPDYAKSLDNLALLVKAQGNLDEAERLFRQALAIRKEALGDKHVDYAYALDNLGKLLLAKRDFTQARRLFQEAMAVRKEASGEFSSDYAASLINLALIEEYNGERTAAKRLIQQALAIRAINDRGAEYGNTLDDLASTLQELGDLEGARQLLERTLVFRKDSAGDHSPEFATALNNLGMLLWSQNDIAGAKSLLDQALKIREETLGKRHPAYLAGLNNLGVLLQSQGDLEGARPFFEQTLKLRKEVLGARSPDYANSLTNMAELLKAEGDFAGASGLYRKAVETFRSSMGERHPAYATSVSNLAACLRAEGDLAAARPFLESALKVRELVPGVSDPSYPATLATLASLDHEMGDLGAAEAEYDRAIAGYLKIRGKPDADCAGAIAGKARVMIDANKLADAQALLEQASQIRREALGRSNPEYQNTVLLLAEVLLAQRKIDSAAPLAEQILELRRNPAGIVSPAYAAALSTMAEVALLRKDFDRAQKLASEALAVRSELLGAGHPAHAINLLNLALIERLAGEAGALGRLESALDAFESAVEPLLPADLERRRLLLRNEHRACLDHALSETAAERSSDERIYARVLRFKGTELDSVLARKRLAENPQARERLAKLTSARSKLNALYNRSARITSALAEKHAERIHELINERRKLEAEFAATLASAKPDPSSGEIVQALEKEHRTLVDILCYSHYNSDEYGTGFIVERRYAAFVLAGAQPIARVELGPADAIDSAVVRWTEKLEKGEPAVGPEAEFLVKTVWTPIAGLLGDARAIVIAPDSGLSGLAWSALPGPEPETYLIDRRQITLTPSPTAWFAAQSAKPAFPGKIVLAAATDLDAPPAAGREADAQLAERSPPNITAALSAVPKPIANGNLAWERALAAAGAKDVRSVDPSGLSMDVLSLPNRGDALAILGCPLWSARARSAADPLRTVSGLESFESLTHSEVVGFDPLLLSGLAFSGARVRPGSIATLEGLASGSIRHAGAIWLVGVETEGTAAAAVAASLHRAGAGIVLLPLWNGDDVHAQAFAARFLAPAGSSVDPAEAFHRAMLETSRIADPGGLGKRAHPRFWARFVFSTGR